MSTIESIDLESQEIKLEHDGQLYINFHEHTRILSRNYICFAVFLSFTILICIIIFRV